MGWGALGVKFNEISFYKLQVTSCELQGWAHSLPTFHPELVEGQLFNLATTSTSYT